MNLVELTSDNEGMQLDAASLLSAADGQGMVRKTRGTAALENQAPHDSEMDMQTSRIHPRGRYDTLSKVVEKEEISSRLAGLASAKPLPLPSAAAVYDEASKMVNMKKNCTVEMNPKLCDLYLRNHRAGRLSNLKCFPHCSDSGHQMRNHCQRRLEGLLSMALPVAADVGDVGQWALLCEMKPVGTEPWVDAGRTINSDAIGPLMGAVTDATILSEMADGSSSGHAYRMLRITSLTALPRTAADRRDRVQRTCFAFQDAESCETWHYSVRTGRWSLSLHNICFSLLRRTSACTFKCVGTAVSTCFEVASARRWKGEAKTDDMLEQMPSDRSRLKLKAVATAEGKAVPAKKRKKKVMAAAVAPPLSASSRVPNKKNVAYVSGDGGLAGNTDDTDFNVSGDDDDDDDDDGGGGGGVKSAQQEPVTASTSSGRRVRPWSAASMFEKGQHQAEVEEAKARAANAAKTASAASAAHVATAAPCSSAGKKAQRSKVAVSWRKVAAAKSAATLDASALLLGLGGAGDEIGMVDTSVMPKLGVYSSGEDEVIMDAVAASGKGFLSGAEWEALACELGRTKASVIYRFRNTLKQRMELLGWTGSSSSGSSGDKATEDLSSSGQASKQLSMKQGKQLKRQKNDAFALALASLADVAGVVADTGTETGTGTGTNTGTDTGTVSSTGTDTFTCTGTDTDTDTAAAAGTGSGTGAGTGTSTGTDTGSGSAADGAGAAQPQTSDASIKIDTQSDMSDDVLVSFDHDDFGVVDSMYPVTHGFSVLKELDEDRGVEARRLNDTATTKTIVPAPTPVVTRTCTSTAEAAMSTSAVVLDVGKKSVMVATSFRFSSDKKTHIHRKTALPRVAESCGAPHYLAVWMPDNGGTGISHLPGTFNQLPSMLLVSHSKGCHMTGACHFDMHAHCCPCQTISRNIFVSMMATVMMPFTQRLRRWAVSNGAALAECGGEVEIILAATGGVEMLRKTSDGACVVDSLREGTCIVSGGQKTSNPLAEVVQAASVFFKKCARAKSYCAGVLHPLIRGVGAGVVTDTVAGADKGSSDGEGEDVGVGSAEGTSYDVLFTADSPANKDLFLLARNHGSKSDCDVIMQRYIMNRQQSDTRRREKALEAAKPTGYKSAFNLWCVDRRVKISRDGEYVGLANNELNIALGKEWKVLVTTTSDKYEALSLVDKERYLSELAVYNKKVSEQGLVHHMLSSSLSSTHMKKRGAVNDLDDVSTSSKRMRRVPTAAAASAMAEQASLAPIPTVKEVKQDREQTAQALLGLLSMMGGASEDAGAASKAHAGASAGASVASADVHTRLDAEVDATCMVVDQDASRVADEADSGSGADVDAS